METPKDKTEFRIGRSHNDIVYHHVADRHYKEDPRYAVCSSRAEAILVTVSLNWYTKGWEQKVFEDEGLRW